ncbi:hypothetical protein TNCV_4259551 [Trichonephila clavipes]|nr:hypothetical protein TNCV_4259551 [Trichonephila clavipes]
MIYWDVLLEETVSIEVGVKIFVFGIFCNETNIGIRSYNPGQQNLLIFRPYVLAYPTLVNQEDSLRYLAYPTLVNQEDSLRYHAGAVSALLTLRIIISLV